MGKSRKYWIGSSDEFDHKPTEFETYIVYNEDDLQDAQHDIALYMADDFMGESDYEDNEPN